MLRLCLWSVWILFSSLGLVCTQEKPPSMILFEYPGVGSNGIHLVCRNGDDNILDAFYWLNGTSLFDFEPSILGLHRYGMNNGVRFILTRETEGNYTCGTQRDPINRIQSEGRLYAAYPDAQLGPIPAINYVQPAASRSVARIRCSIQPGRLVGLYIAVWYRYNGTDSMLVEFRSGMTLNNVDQDKYSVDQSDLSLLIMDVTPEDAGIYRCYLGVHVPDREERERFYTQTRFVNISLVVFDPPMIPEPPMPQVVPLPSNSLQSQGTSTTFSCRATASAAYASSLAITWLHNGSDVRFGPAGKYVDQQIGDPSTTGGVTSITRQLQINNVTLFDSSNVACEAAIHNSDLPDGEPARETAETTLTVLGGFEMSAEITQFGTILFDIQLFKTIPTEVRLVVEYTPSNGEPFEIPIDMGFVNTNSIVYIERNPPQRVRDTGFTVRVALVTPQPRIRGPYSVQSQILDVRDRPLSEEQINIIIIAVSVSFGVFVLLTFVVAIIIVVKATKECRRNTNFQTATQLTGQPPKELDDDEQIKWIAKRFKQLYKMTTGYDGPGQETETEIPDNEVQKTVEEIDRVVSGALHHSKLKEPLREKIIDHIEQQEGGDFLIDRLKKLYASLYTDIYGGQEVTDSLVEFFADSLRGLLKRKPNRREQLANLVKGIIQGLIEVDPNYDIRFRDILPTRGTHTGVKTSSV